MNSFRGYARDKNILMVGMFLFGLIFAFLIIFPRVSFAQNIETGVTILEPANLSQLNTHTPTVTARVTNNSNTLYSIYIDNVLITTIFPHENIIEYTFQKGIPSGIHYITVKQENSKIAPTVLVEILPYLKIPILITPGNNETFIHNQPLIKGFSEEQTTVEVIIDNWLYGTNKTKNTDTDHEMVEFTFKVPQQLKNGEHNITLRTIDMYGTKSGLSNLTEFIINAEIKKTEVVKPEKPTEPVIKIEKEIPEDKQNVFMEEEETKEEEPISQSDEPEFVIRKIDTTTTETTSTPRDSVVTRKFIIGLIIAVLLIMIWYGWKRGPSKSREPPDSKKGSNQQSFWE